jgi:hypothetical protein
MNYEHPPPPHTHTQKKFRLFLPVSVTQKLPTSVICTIAHEKPHQDEDPLFLNSSQGLHHGLRIIPYMDITGKHIRYAS